MDSNVKKKICIIGNNASGAPVSDGGRIKIRLYHELLLRNGLNAYIIDLDKWHKHLFSTLQKIKKAIKSNDTILIMAGPKGSRKIIPIVNFFNKPKKSRIVFCPLGIGTLHQVVSHLTESEVIDFLNNVNYFGIKDKKMARQLKLLDAILPQNEVLSACYKQFYNLENVFVLNNFRDITPTKKEYRVNSILSVVYASRVCEEKGIFDLINSVNAINAFDKRITLDIYGDLQLSNEEKNVFFNSLKDGIRYLGVLGSSDGISTIKSYDLFVLPTKYSGEGTSGSLIEAFLSGTPALISSYSQSKLLISDGVDGFIYKINNQTDLETKLLYIYNNRETLEKIGLSAQTKSVVYTYEYNKAKFINLIVGDSK